MLITRKQYDALVRHCSAWMALRWPEFGRSWVVGGVYVSGRQHAIENLRYQLETLRVEGNL